MTTELTERDCLSFCRSGIRYGWNFCDPTQTIKADEVINMPDRRTVAGFVCPSCRASWVEVFSVSVASADGLNIRSGGR